MRLRHRIIINQPGTATYDANNNPVEVAGSVRYDGPCEFQDIPRGNRVRTSGDEAKVATVNCFLPAGQSVSVDDTWSDPDTSRSGRVLRGSTWRGYRYTKLELQED